MTRTLESTTPHAAARAGAAEWHRIVTELDWDRLPDLLTEQVTYRSPAELEAHHGKDDMVAILRTVFTVLEDFTYLRYFGNGTGYVLEFSARAGTAPLVGADFVEFDEHGKITDVMVMMRPADAVATLTSEVVARLNPGAVSTADRTADRS